MNKVYKFDEMAIFRTKSLEKIQDKIENYNKAINLLKVGI